MKTILVLFAVMLFSVAQSHADPQKLTTVYFTNAVLATALTDAGNTGLATNRSYICIDVGEIADLTAAQSTQDVRILTHTLLTHLYNRIEAQDTTNQPSLFDIGESRTSYTGELWKVEHTVEFYKTVGTWTYPQ